MFADPVVLVAQLTPKLVFTKPGSDRPGCLNSPLACTLCVVAEISRLHMAYRNWSLLLHFWHLCCGNNCNTIVTMLEVLCPMRNYQCSIMADQTNRSNYMELQGRCWWVSMCIYKPTIVVSLNYQYGPTMCCLLQHCPIHVGLAPLRWIPWPWYLPRGLRRLEVVNKYSCKKPIASIGSW